MKKILIFSLAYYPFVGGDGVAVKEITDRLLPSEYAFDMVTLRFNRDLPKVEKIGNITVHRIGFAFRGAGYQDTFTFPLFINKYFFPFLSCIKASRLHRKNSYDAIWSIMANYAGFGALFFKLFHDNVPFILTLQEGDPIPYIKRRALPVYPLFKMIFRKADIVQAISKYLAEFGRTMGHEGEIAVIPNGVDRELFTKEVTDDERRELRNKLGIKEGYKILITSSRLVRKNAVGDIIRALRFLPEKTALLIAGDGPEEKELKELAEKERVADRVSFLGHLSHEELIVALSVSDIFIRPSLSEGFGNSFIEAMAAGVPVVATPVGGITDFLIDPDSMLGKVTPTGFFAEVRNPESIAAKARVIVSDNELRERVIENAKRLVKEQYDWKIIADDMHRRVFEKVT